MVRCGMLWIPVGWAMAGPCCKVTSKEIEGTWASTAFTSDSTRQWSEWFQRHVKRGWINKKAVFWQAVMLRPLLMWVFGGFPMTHDSFQIWGCFHGADLLVFHPIQDFHGRPVYQKIMERCDLSWGGVCWEDHRTEWGISSLILI